jgi:aminopeptidase N
MRKVSVLIVVLVFAVAVFSQRQLGVRPTATGGPLMFEQAVFDVQDYDVAVRADPATQSISGTTIMTARIVIPTNVIVLDLDEPLAIASVTEGGKGVRYERKAGKIWIWFPMTKQVGDTIKTSISYSGKPRLAPNPPWIGGFMWKKTPNGADWISVALQNDGADLLFPCKDHPSDKAATSSMHITVPDPLIGVGPGKSTGTKKNADGTTTFSWRMTNPISNYSLVFNAAPYRLIKDSVKSITGENIPIEFYILPENVEKGPKLIEETKKYNAFFEKYLGPFPFRSQKLGIVETPHLGMEHSTAIAYGNQYKFADDGFDWLMFHEYGHEWWANLVTASDWRDFWIHEGFQSFLDTLWVEETKGKEAYFTAMKNRAKGFKNKQPVAPREPKIAYQVYMAEPDYLNSDGDIYGKGAYVLHTLRYLIGDEKFFKALRRMSYPTKEMEALTDGRQTRLVNTDDFLAIAEQESGMDLDWFFEVYLRQPKLPKLIIAPGPCTVSTAPPGEENCSLDLSWEVPNGLSFPMPVDILVGSKAHRFEMPTGKGRFTYPGGIPHIDPNSWVLKAEDPVASPKN